jgi:hypothetical protein
MVDWSHVPQPSGQLFAGWFTVTGAAPDSGAARARPPDASAPIAVLSPAELAALEAADTDGDFDDPDPADEDELPPGGAEEILADLPEAERDRFFAGLNELAEAGSTEPVPELFGAGFTHGLGGRGCGFAAGGRLDRMAPGTELAAHAEDAWAAGLGRLTDDELAGLLCGWRRLASRAAAAEAACVSELARRRAEAGQAAGREPAMGPLIAEVAAALSLSGVAAGRLVALAIALQRLRPVAIALAAGRIDLPRAAVFAAELDCVPDDVQAAAVAAVMIKEAVRLTAPRLRQALRRAILALLPEAAIVRRERAAREARVELYPEFSGNAVLTGRELPPGLAAAADQHIDALARWLSDRGAGGTLAGLRARVFLCLLGGGDVAALLPGCQDQAPGPENRQAVGPDNQQQAPSPKLGECAAGAVSRVEPTGLRGWVNLTMPLSSWLGQDLAPGEIGAYGTADAAACRELGARLASHPGTRWCVTITGPDGSAVGHACARVGPGSRDPAGFA